VAIPAPAAHTPGPPRNLSQRGVSSISVGRRELWFKADRRGTRTSIGLPGTGLRWTSVMRPYVRTRGIGRVLLWAGAIVAATFVVLHTAHGQTTVYGAGNSSCGSYLEARAGRGGVPISFYMAWLTGYLTGAVQQTPAFDKGVAATDLNAYAVWIDNYSGVIRIPLYRTTGRPTSWCASSATRRSRTNGRDTRPAARGAPFRSAGALGRRDL
jgi:hypothetical protein